MSKHRVEISKSMLQRLSKYSLVRTPQAAAVSQQTDKCLFTIVRTAALKEITKKKKLNEEAVKINARKDTVNKFY